MFKVFRKKSMYENYHQVNDFLVRQIREVESLKNKMNELQSSETLSDLSDRDLIDRALRLEKESGFVDPFCVAEIKRRGKIGMYDKLTADPTLWEKIKKNC